MTDLFGTVTAGVRTAQIAPRATILYDACGAYVENGSTGDGPFSPARRVIESIVPGWTVGLLLQLILAAAALVGAVVSTRTLAGKLSRGSRIA